MVDILYSVSQSLVERLLVAYSKELAHNVDLHIAGDITFSELESQVQLLDEEYAAKIVATVLS